jgi:hypothetical protein
MEAIKRKCIIVNLDPANENVPYKVKLNNKLSSMGSMLKT